MSHIQGIMVINIFLDKGQQMFKEFLEELKYDFSKLTLQKLQLD